MQINSARGRLKQQMLKANEAGGREGGGGCVARGQYSEKPPCIYVGRFLTDCVPLTRTAQLRRQVLGQKGAYAAGVHRRIVNPRHLGLEKTSP